ncbi:hypothetical protein ON010_g3112 [Phytophthora cinnamomi]|nr:hypothetical protein ON010_g3112 [Phytophthora cinnamomi]
MRLSNPLAVVLAAILFANGHALPTATNTDQATVPKLAPSELGTSINVPANENKRSLRSYTAMHDDDNEERYATWKIDKLNNGYWSSFFNKWRGKQHSRATIETKLNKAGLSKERIAEILKYY